jgi:hypothetical protein
MPVLGTIVVRLTAQDPGGLSLDSAAHRWKLEGEAMFITDDERWDALQRRDRTADGSFVFSVRTTGVYCRPSCSGRPKRENVQFHDTVAEAAAAGFRPCKRCRPPA